MIKSEQPTQIMWRLQQPRSCGIDSERICMCAYFKEKYYKVCIARVAIDVCEDSTHWASSLQGQQQGRREDWGGPGQIQKVGLHNMDCAKGVWQHTPRKLWNLTCSKVCSGASEALFRACTQYICTCKLPSSIGGFRSKSTMYGALASGLRSSHVRYYDCALMWSLC